MTDTTVDDPEEVTTEGPGFSAAVWLDFPETVTTRKQAEEFLATHLAAFAKFGYVGNYYGDLCKPIREGAKSEGFDGYHPDFA